MNRDYFFMLFVLALRACNGLFSPKNKISPSLEGTYVNEPASSYSRAFDTLTIAKQGNDGNIYSVDRSVSFNRIKHGKLQAKEYHMEHWAAIYDERSNALADAKKGMPIAYIPAKKKLYLGSTAYLKIQ
jgi:hypothetical protein